MLDIYIQESPLGPGFIRVCDFGMTLMRLSYTFEIRTDTRRGILDSILINNQTSEEGGALYIDARVDQVYEAILQFSGCVQKVCSMSYWTRETVRSSFYEDFDIYVKSELGRFAPVSGASPLANYPVSVDWTLTHGERAFYTFGVLGNDKAKNVTIALLEFQKANLPFVSLVVHEDFESLGKREQRFLMTNADTQYPSLDVFRERAATDIERLAG